ncbi:MAG: hypothetical protein ACJ8H8_15210 [Geminicoccaceae bacterium]
MGEKPLILSPMNSHSFLLKAIPRQRAAALLLFAITFVLSLRQLLRWIIHGDFFHPDSPMLYSAATVSFNYIQFGAVRRGLAGTLVYLLHPNRMVGTAMFYVLSAAALSALTSWIYARLTAARPLRLAIFALLLVCLFRRWGEDTGRPDLAVAALLSGAAILMVHGRLGWATALVASGVFVHETSGIYGLPLLAALLLDQRRYAQLSRRQWLHLAAGLCLPLLVYAGLGLMPRADHATMVHTVREALSEHKYVNWAIYFAISGWRGVETSICQNRTDPNYALHVMSAALIVSMFVFSLAGRDRRMAALALLASAPPLVFLSIIANDFTRWTEFAAMNVWLVCACSPGNADDASDRGRGLGVLRALSAGALFLLLATTRIFPVREIFYAPSPTIEHWAERLGGPITPNLDIVLKRCDPGWLDFLDGPGESKPK